MNPTSQPKIVIAHPESSASASYEIGDILGEGASGITYRAKNLQEWMKKRSSESEIKEIAIQILEHLTYLHRQQPPIVHRDLKPGNILKTEDGKVYLVDFGAVRQAYHDTFMRGSTVFGTYGYMAPEQFRGQAFLSTDLYGLAATLLFLLTRADPGKLPHKQLKINLRSVVKLPPKFADWLDRMLEPIVEQRFTTAAEALAVLNGIQSLPPRLANNRLRKPNNSPIRAIYGNLSEIKFKIQHNRFQLHHWLGGYLCYKCTGNLSDLKVAVNTAWVPLLLFDRSRVIIELQNKYHILAFVLDRLGQFSRKYSLALLFTPAENHWLASEINIFIDRELRRQKLYALAVEEISRPSDADLAMSLYNSY